MGVSSSEIIEALKLPYCSIFKNAVTPQDVGNSVVNASQWFSLAEAVQKSLPEIKLEDILIGINNVEIKGPEPPGEDLHIHISQIVGIVTKGKGTCTYERDGNKIVAEAERGDMIIVPKGAPHFFEGTPYINYSVLEFGPKLDYQKHHYTKPAAQ